MNVIPTIIPRHRTQHYDWPLGLNYRLTCHYVCPVSGNNHFEVTYHHALSVMKQYIADHCPGRHAIYAHRVLEVLTSEGIKRCFNI